MGRWGSVTLIMSLVVISAWIFESIAKADRW